MTPRVCQRPAGRLTRQQRIALELLDQEDVIVGSLLIDEGVRPRPTLDNLITKGLVVCEGHSGYDEDGYVYAITLQGRDAAARLADQRKGS